MLLEMSPLLVGGFIGSQLEVGLNLEVEGRWFEASENREDDCPQIGGLFEGACKHLSCPVGKVEIRVVNKEGMEGVKILEFVWVEQTTGVLFIVPVDILRSCIFFESVDKSVVSE